jgi:hypothetical protein
MSKKPTHTAYAVRENKEPGQKGYWLEIGAAWTNKDGSLSLQLDAMPIGGRVIVRARQEREAQDGGQQ